MSNRRLVEVAGTSEGALSAGFALYTAKKDGGWHYILYSARGLKNYVAQNVARGLFPLKEDTGYQSFIVGFLHTSTYRQFPRGAEVQRAAAQKGWGPLMYRIAMSDLGGIYPDTDGTSEDASRVWLYFYNDPSITHWELTYPSENEDEWLRQVYSGALVEVDSLLAEHERTDNFLDEKYDVRSTTFQTFLCQAAELFFMEMYGL